MPIFMGFAAFRAFLLTPFLTSRFRYLERAGAIPIGLDEHHGLCFTTSLIALPALDLNLYRKATKQASFSDLRERSAKREACVVSETIPYPEHLTVKEAAKALRVTPLTIRRLIAAKKLKAKHVGTRLRINPIDLEALSS
jgi:excisionase family DNA binding protein